MAIEEEIIELVKLIPEFTAPILAYPGFQAFTITSPEVLRRIGYNQVPQDIRKSRAPYLYWEGPFMDDIRQTSQSYSGTGKATFLFSCCCSSLTEASRWTATLQKAVIDYFIAHPVVVLGSYRLVAAIYKERYPMVDDQTIRTSEEFPTSCSVIGFRFGYQSTNS